MNDNLSENVITFKQRPKPLVDDVLTWSMHYEAVNEAKKTAYKQALLFAREGLEAALKVHPNCQAEALHLYVKNCILDRLGGECY